MMEAKEQTKGRMWPYFLMILLFSGVIVNIVMVVLAVNDSSFSVEEHYYKKALNWDKEMAQQRQNDRLHWSIILQTVVKQKASSTGQTPMVLQVNVLDKTKKPLSQKASVEVVSFHSARAAKKYKRTLKRDKSGLFFSTIPFVRAGLWVFRFTVVQGKQRFTKTIQRKIRKL